MKNYLISTDLAMWLLLIAGKVVLCLCILKKRFFSRLPGFCALIFFSTAKSLGLFVIAFWASYAAYYYTYYIGGYLDSALMFLTLIECGREVLPGLSLPQKEKAFAWLAAALGVVLVFTILWPLPAIGNERRIEVGTCLVTAVCFIFIAAYSNYLGLSWSRLLVGVTFTLGLLNLVDGIASAMTGPYPPVLVALVREIRQIAHILAVIAWIVVILSPWGERELTEEGLKKIEAAFARIEASLGAGKVGTL